MTLNNVTDTPLPIIQAPMAGAQGVEMALAVGEGGGLGSLPCALLSAEVLAASLARLASSGRPYNVNFFCHQPPTPDAGREQRWRDALRPFYAELGLDADAASSAPVRQPFSHAQADIVAPFAPPVVSFHFGLPEPELLERVKGWGSRVWSTATTVAEALWLAERGVDAIIAQGSEAGGHRGMFLSDDVTTQVGTLALVPQVAAAVSVPVIAAGGIADAQGVRAALAAGASAVQLGTTYLCCPEANTSALHRAALMSDAARHTALTNLFSGRPARGIVNRLMRELGPMSDLPPAFPLASAALAPLRAAAEKQGSGDFASLWAGQNASGCKAIPAAELTRSLWEGESA